MVTRVRLFQAGKHQEKNQAGVYAYRIPAMVTCKDGSIIAGGDRRYDHNQDWGHIDLVIKRSEDGGRTWSHEMPIVSLATHQDAKFKGQAAAFTLDMALLSDPSSGRIFAFYDMFPQGRGIFGLLEAGNIEPAYQFVDGQAYYCLYKRDSHKDLWGYCDLSGQVYDIDWQVHAYKVCLKSDRAPYQELGQVMRDDKLLGNIYLSDQENLPFRIAHNMFIWMSYSDDFGKSWSCPLDLTWSIKAPWMVFFGVGPGIGASLDLGQGHHRLLVPVYSTNHKRDLDGSQSSALIYSDDGGTTWHRGQAVNDGRLGPDGRILSAETMQDYMAQNTESVPVPIEGGWVLLFMRNRTGKVQVAQSFDGGLTWSGQVTSLEHVPDVYCQLSAIRLDLKEGIFVILANAAGPNRQNGRLSLFKVELGEKRLDYRGYYDLEPGKFAYNALQRIGDDHIAILYEHAQDQENDYSLVFEKIAIKEIFGNIIKNK